MNDVPTAVSADIGDSKAMVAEHLVQVRAAVAECFRAAEADYLTPLEAVQCRLGAARLIKTCLALAAALEGPKSSITQRIVVEHTAAPPANGHAASSPQGEGGKKNS